ncbi:hypothetical protein GCM10027591_03220 [Zhihengliuella somnathii]
MSWTVTFDASHKIKRSGAHATNFARHIARDADQRAGFSFAQRNANIDQSRTAMNYTFVNDGRGGFRKPTVTEETVVERGGIRTKNRPPSAELTDYLASRLATVKAKIRSDAVAMRPLILQLDPKWFEEHNPDWREEGLNPEAAKYINAQMNWAAGEFGHDNLVGGSIHLDETNPQLQLIVTPVTDDGRLSQKDFFKGPGDLKRQRKELCDALEAAGYQPNRTVTTRSKEHLTSAEYAKKADELREQGNALDVRQEALAERESALDERERGLEEARDVLEQDTKALEEQRRDFEDIEMPRLRRKAVTEGAREGREKGIEEAETSLRRWGHKMKEAAREQLRRSIASYTPLLFDEFLDRKDAKGRSYRPIFDRLVDKKIAEFEREHDVVGKMQLEPGDRERFILDGGVALSAEVEDLKKQRTVGD